MNMYRVSRMPGGSHVGYETSLGDQAALGVADAAGWLAGSGIDGLAALARRSNDRKLERAISELLAASESDDVERFHALAFDFARRYPTQEYGYATLAEALQRKGDYASAIASVDRAAELGLGAAECHMLRADIYDDANDTGKAIQEFTLLAQTPEAGENPELRQMCLVARAGLLLRIGDLDQALQDTNQAISILPEASAYFIRGHVYRRKEELGKAVEDYTRAIQLKSDEPNFFVQRAEAYDELGDSAAAMKDRESAEALSSSIPAVLRVAAESSPANDTSSSAASNADSSAERSTSSIDPKFPIATAGAGLLLLFIGAVAGVGFLTTVGILALLGGAIWLAVLYSSNNDQRESSNSPTSPPSGLPAYSNPGSGTDWGELTRKSLHFIVRALIAYLKFCWVAASAILRAFSR